MTVLYNAGILEQKLGTRNRSGQATQAGGINSLESIPEPVFVNI
jgi:hypothetical protein